MNRSLALALTLASISVWAQAASPLPREERVPGGVAIIELGSSAQAPQASFDGQRVTVVPCAKNWCAVVGLNLVVEPGKHAVTVNRDGKSSDIAFTVKSKRYEVQRLTVKEKRFVEPSAEELQRIQKDQEVLTRAFTTWTDATPTLQFNLPARGPLSSHFGLKRYFNGQPRAPHSGLDIAAPEGTSIHAPAPGTVIETGEYFFNGNTVFIDHGAGVVTMYNHLKTIAVKPGMQLNTGDLLGQVGRTGRVTGPHLHWSVSLNNSRVDPMLFLTPEARETLSKNR